MTSAWKDFLAEVDSKPPSEAILQEAERILLEANLTDPSMADGVIPSDLGALSSADVELPVKAFLRRALRCLDVSAQEAIRKKFAVPSGSSGPTAPVARPPASTQALLSGDALDVNKTLVSRGIVVPEMDLADSEMFKLLRSALSKKGEIVTINDLTQKAILPLWLSPESFGGKPVMFQNPSSSIGTLGQFQNVLKSATASPRWFRRIGQWAPTFIKYGIAGVAAGQFTNNFILGHINTVSRISEGLGITAQLHSVSNSTALALLYEQEFRRDLACRADMGEKLDLDTLSWFINQELLSACEGRFLATMAAAGKASRQAVDNSAASAIASAESAPAKPAAAASAKSSAESAPAKQAAAASAKASAPATQAAAASAAVSAKASAPLVLKPRQAVDNSAASAKASADNPAASAKASADDAGSSSDRKGRGKGRYVNKRKRAESSTPDHPKKWQSTGYWSNSYQQDKQWKGQAKW